MPTKLLQPGVPNVLVVDDTPANLQLLAEMLREQGYRVRLALSGPLALQAAQNEPPDLFLLDISMPEMDGYAVCAKLKADARLREIPVIFISALAEPVDKVKAFRVGGVDYLTKPFHGEEVVARVRTHLEIRRQRRELQEQCAQLRAVEALRDNLVHMIVHDLRSPLTCIQGGLELLADSAQISSADDRKWMALAQASSRELEEMIDTLLDVTRLESSQMPLHLAPADLLELARHGIERLAPQALLRCDVDDGGAARLPVVCDGALVIRVIANLLGNALKFSPENSRVGLFLRIADGRAVMRVSDCGPGIPVQYHEKIFEKFGQIETRKTRKKASTGLGLTFCKLAVEAHGGRIGVESADGQGSTFWFELPVNGRPAEAGV